MNINMPKNLIVVISLFLSLIIGAFLIWPKYQELALVQAEIERQSSELRNRESYLEDLRSVSSKLEEHKDNFSKIDSALPSEISLPSLFNFIQQKASENGLFLKEIKLAGIQDFSLTKELAAKTEPVEEYPAQGVSFQPSAVQSAEKTGIKKIVMSCSLTGSYPAFKTFLSAVEKSARFVEVKNISFSASKEKETPFSFNLTVETYSY